ncbi:hypothetical membrane protein [Desulfotalea psychrophila LSv54]|uniref:Hypothetical membrane protein n=1 Tax=Desulfotalea psychrophila (strain LSv54 / DSM 12343) TaxID=177439 RepID=Q6AR48_DESPS|nr:hypothetical membrane protein [Desulfotalea psychrophila LSv54]
MIVRSQFDRIRHTVLFEVFGVIFSAPLAAFILTSNFKTTGIFAVSVSMLAMFWNWLYNMGFDHLLVRMGRSLTNRPPVLRALHAILFEFGLLTVTIPGIMWWFDLSLSQALMTDIGFVVFYLFYAYLYNWCYDRIFPYGDVQLAG